MGRKRKFDETEVLQKAMLLFWRKGYEAVSTRELAKTMGINQFSLYAAFENKEVLYERALAHYFHRIIQDWLAKPLTVPGAGKESLRTFFEMFVEPGDGSLPTGCMIFNTMMIDLAKRTEINVIIDEYETLLTSGFANIIRHDFPEASAEVVQSKASLLLCLLAGIAIKKRNGFEGRPVQLVVDQIINSIYGEE